MGWGPRLNTFVHLPLLRRLIKPITARVLPGGYWYETVRTKAMDEVVLEELAAGADQLVILGAGFDSRAYRFREELEGKGAFEVDHPTTSRLKRERVTGIFGELPEHVGYVAVDFEHDDLAECLRESGFDDRARTIFVWSGVSMYITEEAVRGVLDFVREHSGPGSAIVFDYIFREFLEGDDTYFGASQLRRLVERQGEPFRFGVPEGEIGEFLDQHGLVLERHHTASDMPERYLVDSSGKIAGRTYECGGLCVARRP